eukprot:20179-Heterococcus_DN1.PRE.5
MKHHKLKAYNWCCVATTRHLRLQQLLSTACAVLTAVCGVRTMLAILASHQVSRLHGDISTRAYVHQFRATVKNAELTVRYMASSFVTRAIMSSNVLGKYIRALRQDATDTKTASAA